MIRSRFLWKLYVGYAAVILISVATIGVLVTRQIMENSLEEIRLELRGKAFLLADMARGALRSGQAADLQERVRRAAAENRERLTVILADGTVLADSQREPGTMDNHAGRDEVREALQHGAGSSVRYSKTLGTRLMYYALMVTGDDRPLGVVRTAMPLNKIDQRLASLRRHVAIGGVTAVITGLILGLVFARRVTRPLTSITEAAEALAGGDYQRRVDVTGHDEVGTLARAFNAMAAVQRERMETIIEDRNKVVAILRSMVEGVIAVDREERVVQINSVAAGLLHTSLNDSMGRRIWEVTRVKEVCGIVERTLSSGQDQHGEIRTPAGLNDQIVEVTASSLRDAEGCTAGAVVVLHDVTEQRRLETMRRDFVANVSHELKTPLTAIRGLVETLREDGEMERAVRERFLEKVDRQANRLAALVTDLLSLSRLESQESPLDRKHLDLREPTDESFQRHQADAEAKGLALRQERPEQPVLVRADAEAVRQVVDNLLQNAIRYTPRGGQVTVRVRREEDRAVLEVADTGIGIEPRHQARVFERFYRVDTARSREMGGTGLGLAIVKHIVQAHQGDVSLDSEPGQGSTFRVRLPITEM